MSRHGGSPRLGRRGALAAVVGSAALAASGSSAKAAPTSNVRRVAPSGAVVTTTIASAPKTGYAYRTLWYLDFLPLDPASANRVFAGTGGAYSTAPMEAQIDIPAGAHLREIEWYVANTSGSSVTFSCALWTPASGSITTFADAVVPSVADGAPKAIRVVTTEAEEGPYPAGAKLIFYAPTTSPSCLLNGVRAGFSGGGLEYSLRRAPKLVYDTKKTGGKFAAKETRALTISETEGSSGLVLLVSATGSTADGIVMVYPSDQSAPDIGSLPITANAESVGQVTVALPANQKVKMSASSAVHLKIYQIGTFR